MTALVKICGLNDPAAVDAAAKAGADFAGFMFFEKSPRHISLDAARALAAHVPYMMSKVAVVVDPSDTLIGEIDDALSPDYLQLHGNETPARVAEIREKVRLKIIKVIAVAGAADVEKASVYDGVADLLLFDTKAPKGERPGGWGTTFDWSLIAGSSWTVPWLLAGGLTPGNVAEAIKMTGAPGVDVSSGVETASGVKSPALIEEFVARAKA